MLLECYEFSLVAPEFIHEPNASNRDRNKLRTGKKQPLDCAAAVNRVDSVELTRVRLSELPSSAVWTKTRSGSCEPILIV